MPLYPLTIKQRLLFFYNIVSATLWFCCFARFLILLPLVGRRFLPGGIADFFQTIAITPLLGSILVLILNEKYLNIKSQLWSIGNGIKMIWICYGVIFPYPKIAKHTSYSMLITAWSLQYFINYSYHAFKLKTKTSPFFLFWLQYNNFYILYLLGTIAEMIQIFLSLAFVDDDSYYELFLRVVFLAYIPIAYYTWGHLKKRKNLKYSEVMRKRTAIFNNETQLTDISNTAT
ncbi:hypothetical protein KGF54_002328 [Candida jiufengensis]|uniref:uncharacterized protein n=1 Tax=Candida jiufengensis TaxID=497108 RepID=UPI002225525E|nr:uncharacterized protein KGF54_002328 [Candida jiufengensis]KAI5954553.1 hypothetical protein KGF54_002328 [Candida jiufengensis]